jgi:enoyl-CoA hydratase/carnithine racemase
MTYETLLMETSSAGIATLTLNRPGKLNALTELMFTELHAALQSLETREDVRVVILTGAGRGFCAGLDLDLAAELPAMPTTRFYTLQKRWAAAVAALRFARIPIIAAVNGAAAGAGFSLALAADLRVTSAEARFNAAFVRIGLSGGDCGISWLLPRVVGLGLASEILLTGRFVTAEESLRIGLSNRVVPAGDLIPAAAALAAQIAANSPFGVALTKEILQTNVDAPSLTAAIELENRSQVLAACTADMAEALAAFREKRAPVYTGT